MGGVAALVAERLVPAGRERAVGPHPAGDGDLDRVPDAVRHERLLARDVEFDRPAADLRAHPGAQRLVQHVLLVTEAAADVGLDDLDLAPADAERLPDDAAHDVRDLRRGGHRQPVALGGAEHHVVLDVAVLHGPGVVGALDLRQAGLGDGLLVVADRQPGVRQHVARVALLDLRRAGRQRLRGAEDERQFLIGRLERGHPGPGRQVGLGDDDGDLVAVVAHVPVEQQPVGHVLVAGVGRPRMACGREDPVGHVEARQDPDHARDLEGAGRVDRRHVPVRDRRVHDADDQGVGGTQVVGVPGPAQYLVPRVLAFHALAHGSAGAEDRIQVVRLQVDAWSRPGRGSRLGGAGHGASLHSTFVIEIRDRPDAMPW